MRLVWRNFLVLLHNFVVYFLVVLVLKPSLLGFTGFPGDTGSGACFFERALGLPAVRDHLLAVSRRAAVGLKCHADRDAGDTAILAGGQR